MPVNKERGRRLYFEVILMSFINRQWVLTNRPKGNVSRDDLTLREAPVRELHDDEVLVRNLYLPLDPTNRLWMSAFTHELLQPSIDIRGSTVAAYDGVAELWWSSREDLLATLKTGGARTAGRILLNDERKFIDLENSPMFYAQEHVVIS
jgi:hypothetical protein